MRRRSGSVRPDDVGHGGGALPDGVDVGGGGADKVDVADLPAGPHGLAVAVDLRRGIAGEGRGVGGKQVLVVPAEEVLHHDDGTEEVRGAERQVQDGAQVLLELAGHRAVLGPVSGVVRAHGELVDQEAGAHARSLEQFHGHDAGHAELVGDPDGGVFGCRRHLNGDVQGRGDHFVADAVDLDGVHHRPRPGLAVRGPRDQGREFAAELHLGFGQQGGHGVEPCRGFRGVLGRGDDPHALAVVAAAGHLQDHGPAGVLAEGDQLRNVGHRGPPRVGQLQPVDGGAHHQLVLGVDQGIRAGVDVDAGLEQGAEVLRGDVLVVEGQHVQAAGELEQVRPGPYSRRPARWPRRRRQRRRRPRQGHGARSPGRWRQGPSCGQAGRRQQHRLQEKSQAPAYRKPRGFPALRLPQRP